MQVSKYLSTSKYNMILCFQILVCIQLQYVIMFQKTCLQPGTMWEYLQIHVCSQVQYESISPNPCLQPGALLQYVFKYFSIAKSNVRIWLKISICIKCYLRLCEILVQSQVHYGDRYLDLWLLHTATVIAICSYLIWSMSFWIWFEYSSLVLNLFLAVTM